MIADFFEMEGWDTFFLGANTPSESVVRELVERDAHLLAVSVTMTFDLPVASNLIRSVKESPRTSRVRILIGGNLLTARRICGVSRRADCFASDAREAIEIARNLLST